MRSSLSKFRSYPCLAVRLLGQSSGGQRKKLTFAYPTARHDEAKAPEEPVGSGVAWPMKHLVSPLWDKETRG